MKIVISMVGLLLCSAVNAASRNVPVETNLTSNAEKIKAWLQIHDWPRMDYPGDKPWTAQVKTIYIPELGLGWAGSRVEENMTVMEDRIISIFYQSQRGREAIRIGISTNRYPLHLTDVAPVMQAECNAYTNSKSRSILSPPYHVYLESLLGSLAVRDHEDPKRYNGAMMFASETWPSQFKGVTVEGTNLVVTVEFGTNTLAKIAFDKNIRPVWATTNGVSIGPIPTNCVFYSDIISNKVVTRVVY